MGDKAIISITYNNKKGNNANGSYVIEKRSSLIVKMVNTAYKTYEPMMTLPESRDIRLMWYQMKVTIQNIRYITAIILSVIILVIVCV